jgi:hypothetical protein
MKMTKYEISVEALARAQTSASLANYPAIFAGFIAKGIPEAQIEPRVNVLTYNAWQAKDRQVRRGEKGVKVVTFVPVWASLREGEREEDRRVLSLPRTTTVFHISQTDPVVVRPIEEAGE